MSKPTKPSTDDMAVDLVDALTGINDDPCDTAIRRALYAEWQHEELEADVCWDQQQRLERAEDRCRELEKLLKLADDVICEATWGQTGDLDSTSDKIRKALATPPAGPGGKGA